MLRVVAAISALAIAPLLQANPVFAAALLPPPLDGSYEAFEHDFDLRTVVAQTAVSSTPTTWPAVGRQGAAIAVYVGAESVYGSPADVQGVTAAAAFGVKGVGTHVAVSAGHIHDSSSSFVASSTAPGNTLYHYTDEAGLDGIVSSGELRPSLGSVNPNDDRYGNGQYVSDIVPGTRASERSDVAIFTYDETVGVAQVASSELPGSDGVVANGRILQQPDGRRAYVAANGDGSYSAVVLDGPLTTSEVVTVFDNLSSSGLDLRISDGRWTPVGDL